MIKKYFTAILLACSLMFAGCQKAEENQQTDTQLFFTALNHLFEASSIEADGHLDADPLISTDFSFYMDQNDQLQVALVSDNDSQPISFYLKDGKTYLDFNGTKSQSVAENIGITPDTKFEIYNPFLDLSNEERNELFTRASHQGDHYTFQINTEKLSSFIDQYGSITVNNATLECDIQDEKITSLDFRMNGNASFSSQSLPVSLNLQLDILKENEPLNIPWPSDLENW